MKESTLKMNWRCFRDGWFFTLGWLIKLVCQFLYSPLIYFMCAGWIPLLVALIIFAISGDNELAAIVSAFFQFIPLTIHTYLNELGEDTACSKELFFIVCIFFTVMIYGVF